MPRAAKKLQPTQNFAALENAYVAHQIAIDNEVRRLALENDEARLRDLFEDSQAKLEFEDSFAVVDPTAEIRKRLELILEAKDAETALRQLSDFVESL